MAKKPPPKKKKAPAAAKKAAAGKSTSTSSKGPTWKDLSQFEKQFVKQYNAYEGEPSTVDRGLTPQSIRDLARQFAARMGGRGIDSWKEYADWMFRGNEPRPGWAGNRFKDTGREIQRGEWRMPAGQTVRNASFLDFVGNSPAAMEDWLGRPNETQTQGYQSYATEPNFAAYARNQGMPLDLSAWVSPSQFNAEVASFLRDNPEYGQYAQGGGQLGAALQAFAAAGPGGLSGPGAQSGYSSPVSKAMPGWGDFQAQQAAQQMTERIGQLGSRGMESRDMQTIMDALQRGVGTPIGQGATLSQEQYDQAFKWLTGQIPQGRLGTETIEPSGDPAQDAVRRMIGGIGTRPVMGMPYPFQQSLLLSQQEGRPMGSLARLAQQLSPFGPRGTLASEGGDGVEGHFGGGPTGAGGMSEEDFFSGMSGMGGGTQIRPSSLMNMVQAGFIGPPGTPTSYTQMSPASSLAQSGAGWQPYGRKPYTTSFARQTGRRRRSYGTGGY